MKSKAALLLLIIFQPSRIDADYQIGVGRGDCTGPAAEIIFVSTENFPFPAFARWLVGGLRENFPSGMWPPLATIFQSFHHR
jgi:hypothetical protein